MTTYAGSDIMTAREAADRRALLLHVAASAPTGVDELARRAERDTETVAETLDVLLERGEVRQHGAHLHAADPGGVLDDTPAHELRQVHERVLTDLVEQPDSAPAPSLQALVDSGCEDPQLLQLLVRGANDGRGGPRLATALDTLAGTLGVGAEQLRLIRAEDAAARGRRDRALSLTDTLLSAADPTVARSAAVVAAAVHTQNDRLDRSAALYQHVGAEAIGDAAAWAVVTGVGLGDAAAARQWRDTMAQTAPTNLGAGLCDLADGVLASLAGDGATALDLLARSAVALAPYEDDAVLPDTPAALAAVVALHRGEAAAAEVVLDRALLTGLGGATGRRRHLLLSAWACMVQGRLDEAEERIALAGDTEDLPARDLLLLMGLRGGIARRRSDQPATRAAWREIRKHILGLGVSLYDLLPLGEIVVVAARVGDGARMQSLLHDAMALLERLGDPPAWTASLHWCGLQAAFLSENPSALVPHADALVRASHESRYAAALAAAGQSWLAIVRGDAETAAVEAAVLGLADAGHPWDASRLAGHAATRGRDRENALALMQLARRVDGSAGARSRETPGQDGSPLTERELDVARLVLAGHGYRTIGERLFISPKTVEHHVARIRRRLGASSRAELLRMLRDLVDDVEAGS